MMIYLSNELQNVNSIAIGGHVRPDGDCLGSCMGMYKYLKENYPEIETDLYLEDIPDSLQYLPGTDCINHIIKDRKYELFIALDASDPQRLGFALPLFEEAAKTICIDHHISNQGYATKNYIVADASSASELVFDVLDEEKLSLAVAECLYLGIVHDTGVFQYSNCKPKTLMVASKLLSFGVDASNMIAQTFYAKSIAQQRILSYVILKGILHEDGLFYSSYLTQEEMLRFGVTAKDFNGIVSQMIMTKGVEVSIFLYEQEKDLYKVSMRSGDRYNVSTVASAFGGGGHIKASGASISGDPEEIIAQLIDQLKLQN